MVRRGRNIHNIIRKVNEGTWINNGITDILRTDGGSNVPSGTQQYIIFPTQIHQK